MLEVKVTDNHTKYGFDGRFTLLELLDGGNPIGGVALTVEGAGEEKAVIIKGLKCEESVLGDFLIRSAAAYGDNRYCFNIISEDKENENIYKGLGFTENEGKITLPISKIVHKTHQN